MNALSNAVRMYLSHSNSTHIDNLGVNSVKIFLNKINKLFKKENV